MHLPIRVVGRSQPVEVPFQLQPSFKFAVHIPGLGVQEFAADLTSLDAMTAKVSSVEAQRAGVFTGFGIYDAAVYSRAKDAAESILSAILSRLGLVEVGSDRRPRSGIHGETPPTLTWIGIAHEAEKRTAEACKAALVHLTPVWRDRTEPAPKVGVAADILDSYYQQVQDEVIGEWEDKAQREAADYLTGRSAGGNSEVAP